MVAESFLRQEPADGSAPRLVSIQRDPALAATLETVDGFLADGRGEAAYPSLEAGFVPGTQDAAIARIGQLRARAAAADLCASGEHATNRSAPGRSLGT